MKRREQVALTLMYVLFIYGVAMALTSCATSKGCHTKGHYVSKDIKRAQSKPRNY
jgi:hypothetical protein